MFAAYQPSRIFDRPSNFGDAPLTAATGLRRLAIAVPAALAAVLVTLIALSFLIPAAAVRDAVKSEIHAVTGLDPVLRGDTAVSLFPSGTVTLHNVLLGGGGTGETAVVVDELTAHLRYFPLLAGRIEIADVTLVRPTISVTFEPGGQSNWSGLIEALARALEPGHERMASFSEIGIKDGTVVIHNHYAGRNIVEQLDGVEFQLAWPSISRSFGANGRFVWHDQPIEASLTLGDFLAALTGERSGLKVRLNGAPVKVAFDGAASYQPTLKIEGTLSAESPSLREAMRWTDDSKLPFGGFGRFALRAQSQIGGGVVSLTGVNVELDGNAAEGVITLTTDGHRMVQGTLAADGLDLTPYVSGVRFPGGERAQLGPVADRARRARRPQSRFAAVGRQHQDRRRATRPHGGRRQYARRQARSDHRRVRRPSAALPKARSASPAPMAASRQPRMCNSPTSTCRAASAGSSASTGSRGGAISPSMSKERARPCWR